MSLGLIFWVLMLIWLVGGIYYGYANPNNPYLIGGNVLLFILLLVLGWAAFGPPIHG